MASVGVKERNDQEQARLTRPQWDEGIAIRMSAKDSAVTCHHFFFRCYIAVVSARILVPTTQTSRQHGKHIKPYIGSGSDTDSYCNRRATTAALLRFEMIW